MGELHGRVEHTLARLVGFDSVSHKPLTELAGWLADRAEAVGMRVERFETQPGKVNVVASAGPPGTEGLVLSGHMDVVPVAGQAWSTDPFELTAVGDRLVGRGACDMKGFIAAAVEAVADTDLSKLKRELVLVWTHDEEAGCEGSKALVDALSAEGRTLPEAVVIGEPTGFSVARVHPGHASFEVRCTGRPAHTSRPSLGLSAIGLAHDVLTVLQQLKHDLKAEQAFADLLPTPHTVLTVAGITGGEAINIVPEHCTITVGMRPLPGVAFHNLLATIRERLAPLQAQAERDGGRIVVCEQGHIDGLHTPHTCTHLPLLLAHADHPTATGVPFATDGGNLARLGCAPLVFGPGSIDVAHRPDEFLHRSDLARAHRVVQDLILARCVA